MKGQAFINFPTEVLAEKAVKAVHGYILHGKPMVIVSFLNYCVKPGLHIVAMIVSTVTNWLSSRNFFQGGKIYCYANFYCYSIVFGPNFREERKFSGGQTSSGGRLPAPSLWKKANKYVPALY